MPTRKTKKKANSKTKKSIAKKSKVKKSPKKVKRKLSPKKSSKKPRKKSKTTKTSKQEAEPEPPTMTTPPRAMAEEERKFQKPVEEKKQETISWEDDPESLDMNTDEDSWGADGDNGWGQETGDWGDIEDPDGGNLRPTKDNEWGGPVTSYQILPVKDLVKLRLEMVAEVQDALFPDTAADNGSDMAISLLQQYNWRKSKVLHAFCNNPSTALEISGITPLKTSKANQGGMMECPQCYDDYASSEMFSLKCGHLICRSCWSDYLEYQVVEEGGSGMVIRCPMHQCNLVVPNSIWARILTPTLLAKRDKFLMDQFVRSQPDIVWCPGKECGRAIKDPNQDCPEVNCDCGHQFCFKCQEPTHRPCKCSWARQWVIKCSSEAENATWIMANTKRCPKCQTQIEKNQGCNHMTCRHCKHEFCWLCKGDWKDHGTATGGYYSCNRYEEAKKKGNCSEEERKAADAKNELQKYLHFYQRFDNHHKAREFAIKSLPKIQSRMKNLQELKGGGFNDVAFLEKAVETVIECRKLLQWTYAMGYYMESGTKEKLLFEHLQEDLEKHTEHLHELSEKPLDDLVSQEMRAKIINFTRVTHTFRVNLTQGIEQGLTTEF